MWNGSKRQSAVCGTVARVSQLYVERTVAREKENWVLGRAMLPLLFIIIIDITRHIPVVYRLTQYSRATPLRLLSVVYFILRTDKALI